MLRIYVTQLVGRRGRNPKAKITLVKKVIGFGMWEQLLDNLDKVFDYNTTDVHTLEIDNLIRSAAKAIDPDTEMIFQNILNLILDVNLYLNLNLMMMIHLQL